MSSTESTIKTQQGFVLASVLTFIPLVILLSTIVIGISLQSYRSSLNQELIRQAQLASTAAMDYAKEQYELDQTYVGTPETLLYTTNQHDVMFEVIHEEFTNPTNTQQDIRGVGRVYKKGTTDLLYEREIQGKITFSSGDVSSARFIFIVDNSGSMSISEWLQSKATIDATIEYVLDNTSSAEVAVVQYGTNNTSQEHKYNVTVPFTRDLTTATSWGRRYGPGSPSTSDFQDHLPGSLARMRLESVYGPGDILDLAGATDVQFVLFTDAIGQNNSWCCSSLKKLSSEPAGWHDNNGAGYNILENYGEYNALKDGTVFAGDGYAGLSAQWTVLSINNLGTTPATSAALASPGGTWSGAIDSNVSDPEGNGVLPRRFISTSLLAGPDEIISVIQEILDQEINF